MVFLKHTLTKYEWLLNWPASQDCLKGDDPSLQQPTTPCKGPPVLCKCDSLCPFVYTTLLCDTRLSKCYEPMEGVLKQKINNPKYIEM